MNTPGHVAGFIREGLKLRMKYERFGGSGYGFPEHRRDPSGGSQHNIRVTLNP
jgi:hypothetical protein